MCGDFDSELQEFKLRMMTQILNVLGPFLTFFQSFIQSEAYNMLAIMLDLCFKNMKVIIWEILVLMRLLQIRCKGYVSISITCSFLSKPYKSAN
jgi:hypothetical protein